MLCSAGLSALEAAFRRGRIADELTAETGLPVDVVDVERIAPVTFALLYPGARLLVERDRPQRIAAVCRHTRSGRTCSPTTPCSARQSGRFSSNTRRYAPGETRAPAAPRHRSAPQAVSRAAFLADEALQLAIEHALQEAIAACLALGRHALADLGAALPDANRGVCSALAQQGGVPRERVEQWADLAGFRNVLVHGYDEVDLDIVYRAWHERLDDLEAFGRAVLAPVETRPDPAG